MLVNTSFLRMCISIDIKIEELYPELLASVARLPADLLRHGHGELAAHRSVMEILVLDITGVDIYVYICLHICLHIQGVPKKMSFSGKKAITTFKLIQNANVGGVLENSGYLLRNGH